MMTLFGGEIPDPEKTGKKKDHVAKWPAKDLEAIYKQYPRQVAKIKAIEAIAKALDIIKGRDVLDPVAWLLDVTHRYKCAVHRQDKKYIPYPATWFNAGQYDDDPGEWDVGQGSSLSPTDAPPAMDWAKKYETKKEIESRF